MLTNLLALVALLFTAAIFGFFYAYSVSAMWGLDVVAPATAIEAMQGINSQVRNAAFFPAFFLTPVLLALSAWSAYGTTKPAAFAFGAAAIIYLSGGLILTMLVNVPMNEALAQIIIPDDPTAAAQIWAEYSAPWLLWNHIRTAFSGVAVLLAGGGLLALSLRV
ncbi:DUF1772 domain-containing protein [Octadecabacter sp. 1_MG-2023]|uniref:anthrone oxygenase family protein n=1 Tax=unclassified Octadecabacter TaxID=196158 RepID=UPI001C082BE8|nr:MULTISPECIES: anthrone oxygenase family protein [unclassified Octadecabacter]MBU2992822.1 DUF1772 domain-containing protein [Octadecabacter sp. B2R22]MDO6733727.1 DUF1772 domain-containing protein [Octadecabacter sp. 1_MG-2023]